MRLEQFYNLKEISFRSYKICLDNELNSLNLILNYYNQNNSFIELKNCGKESNEELVSLCIKYIELSFTELKHNNDLLNKINLLKENQKDLINKFIDFKLNNLSNRSKNVLGIYLNGDFNFNNIRIKILENEKFNLRKLKNAGSKTAIELSKFIDTLKSYIENIEDEIILNSVYDNKTSKINKIIEKTFPTSTIPEEIINSNSIFSLVECLFNQNQIFYKEENNIIRKTFKIYKNQTLYSLEKISEESNIPLNKVRSIRKRILFKLSKQFTFLSYVKDDFYNKYKIEANQNYIYIDDELSCLINNTNKTNFSREFISLLIYSYLNPEYDLIGNIEILLYPKYFNSRVVHNWNNFYLFKNNLTKYFDFENFTNEISNRLKERIDETYMFNFKSYVSSFINSKDKSIINDILPLAEKIINEEFNLLIDLNENIVFKRNTIKQIHEYVIEILDKNGIPMNIIEIYNILNIKNPNLTKSPEALRGTIQRAPEIIIIGKSSTYGLKKWEIEKEGIKGGTIKDIVFEYLQNKNEPVHIFELLNEVHKYRDKTTTRNISTNLKLDPQKQFIVFNQNFIGLKNKEYNSNLIDLPKFFGKSIIKFIKQKELVNRDYVEFEFSNKFEISKKNVSYIIDHLIENKYIYNTNQNNLIYEC